MDGRGDREEGGTRTRRRSDVEAKGGGAALRALAAELTRRSEGQSVKGVSLHILFPHDPALRLPNAIQHDRLAVIVTIRADCAGTCKQWRVKTMANCGTSAVSQNRRMTSPKEQSKLGPGGPIGLRAGGTLFSQQPAEQGCLAVQRLGSRLSARLIL